MEILAQLKGTIMNKHTPLLIDKIVDSARKQGLFVEHPHFDKFIQQFYYGTPVNTLGQHNLTDLLSIAQSLFEFAKIRQPGKPKIRAFNTEFSLDGVRHQRSVIEIINDDMPFIVDSLSQCLTRLHINIHVLLHPVYHVERAQDGTLNSVVLDTASAFTKESIIYIECDIIAGATSIDDVINALCDVIYDIQKVTSDWQPMLKKAQELQLHLDKVAFDNPFEDKKLLKGVTEASSFIQWLMNDRFTFMGYQSVKVDTNDSNSTLKANDIGLGILSEQTRSLFNGMIIGKQLKANFVDFFKSNTCLQVIKADTLCTVHRSTRFDVIYLKSYTDKGEVAAHHLLVGLFARQAYHDVPSNIPFLSRKVKKISEILKTQPNSHRDKTLQYIISMFPRDEFFQADVAFLAQTMNDLIILREIRRTMLFVRYDALKHHASIFIYLPEERFLSQNQSRIANALCQHFNGKVIESYTAVIFQKMIGLHLIIHLAELGSITLQNDESASLLSKVEEITIPWVDQLRPKLIEHYGINNALNLLERFASDTNAFYIRTTSAKQAIDDFKHLSLLDTQNISVTLYQQEELKEHSANYFGFRVFLKSKLILSDIMPTIENLGSQVMSERIYEIGENPYFIYDFTLKPKLDDHKFFAEIEQKFCQVFMDVWKGRSEDDGLNALVLAAGFEPAQIVIVRAMIKYLKQLSFVWSTQYVIKAIVENAKLVHVLIAMFDCKFADPSQKFSTSQYAKLEEQFNLGLKEVASLDHDQIMRWLLSFIEACVRTNSFMHGNTDLDTDAPNANCFAFKLDSQKINNIVAPIPFREIFVYAPDFEAVHLRFGKIARGGIRWSDRSEDFRTEVLGLVKAQQVKNAVIIPVGAKGGFFVKNTQDNDPREVAVECYKKFIHSMLDITDNVIDGKIIAPKQVLIHEEEDSYLVVAADKGTATFSDYANAISLERKFWLGDAFASGGSNGYDHKKMGITARGAWESVKQHFRELGRNIQKQDFTVAGVGDMAGDVFGNGMMLSPHIKLVAAFNHLHIFLDPNPEIKASFKERKRLFNTPKTSWADYNRDILSKGAMIILRSEKSIKITKEVAQLLNLEIGAYSPDFLLSAILRSPVDLLWFGGIGTYIKASSEEHIKVSDPANDSIRVDAIELKAKVIGEGANLGMTQLARIEFSKLGGHCNSDAIDNSAGVDCSDHEVNIKIVLEDLKISGILLEKDRNHLLEEMTDNVAELVLVNNYQQTQALSVCTHYRYQYLDQHQHLMRTLEKSNKLSRTLEFLSDDEEITRLRQAQSGLSRPELGVLLAYAKNDTTQKLLETDLPDEPYLIKELLNYFPTKLLQQYQTQIEEHQLRREIVATIVANAIINRTDPAFFNELVNDGACDVGEVAKAAVITARVFDLHSIWHQIESLDNKVPSHIQIMMLHETRRTMERMTKWLLLNRQNTIKTSDTVEFYLPKIKHLSENFNVLLNNDSRKDHAVRVKKFSADGIPKKLATSLANLKALSMGCDIAKLADKTNTSLNTAATIYGQVGYDFAFDRLRTAANLTPVQTNWQILAIHTLGDDLWQLQYDICHSILMDNVQYDHWLNERQSWHRHIQELIAKADATLQIDVPVLAVISRAIRQGI